MTSNSVSFESSDNSVTRMPLWRRLAMITSLAIGLFYTARIATKPVPVNAALVESVSEPRTCCIDEITLGMRVVARNPLRHETSSPSNIIPENWRAIHLTMNQNGTEYKLAFLRSVAWLKSASAVQGHTIRFSLPEMGLDGTARVDSIQPCPAIEPDDGTGRMVVTGTMRHLAANIMDLHVTGLDQPIGVTDTHPIWSETRKDFVPAGQLRVGEELRTLHGAVARVEHIAAHSTVLPEVFNLEIDAEHVYGVTGQGLLVHNSCPEALKIFERPHGGDLHNEVIDDIADSYWDTAELMRKNQALTNKEGTELMSKLRPDLQFTQNGEKYIFQIVDSNNTTHYEEFKNLMPDAKIFIVHARDTLLGQ